MPWVLTDEIKAQRIAAHKKRVIGAILLTRMPSHNPDTSDVSYGIFLGSDDHVYCDCKAWEYSKAELQSCKHMSEFRAGLQGAKP